MNHAIGREYHLSSLLKFAFPTMTMMVFMSLYVIVDGIFVARFVGTNALSAVNIIYPLLNVLMAVGIMLATGGNAIVAKKMGEQKYREAKEDFSFLVVCGVAFGLIALGLGSLSRAWLIRVLGATTLLEGYCADYLQVLLFFAPITILQLLFQSFFVTAGKPNLGLTVTVIGGLANMALDYVLIVPLDMGIQGAALATGIGQAIPAISGLLYFTLTKKGSLRFVRPKIRWGVLGKSCSNGISEMVTNLALAVVTVIYNYLMLSYLGEDGVAAITIVLYAEFLFNSLFLGFSMGVAPIFSYNFGSRNNIQLKRIFKICLGFLGVTSLIILAAALLFAPEVVHCFAPRGSNTYNIAVPGLTLFSTCFLFSGINIFASAFFTALSDGRTSAIISFSRTFLFTVSCLAVLPPILGVNGIFLAVPVAEAFTIAVSAFFFRRKRIVYYYWMPEGTDLRLSEAGAEEGLAYSENTPNAGMEMAGEGKDKTHGTTKPDTSHGG